MRHRLVPALILTMLATAGPASAGTVGHVRCATDTHAVFPSYDQSARRHGFVILHAWQQDRMQALKAANPGLKVLLYKNLSFSNYMRNSGFSAVGVPAADADRDHPEWFLLNTSGERFTSSSYGWSWAMDVGSPSYQQRWADNVIAELRSQGWDGVFMDDTNPTMKFHYNPSAIAKYASDEAYSAATRSALATIAPRVRAAGKLAIANIGSQAGYPAAARDWLQFLDGAMDEMFLKWGNTPGTGYASTSRWRAQLEALKLAERDGKFYLAITHSSATDQSAARYGYATMLLGSEGRGHFALAADYTNETWFPEYDYQLGEPLGPSTVDSNGLHRREFARGLVLVNPTGSVKQAEFGGAYSGSGLQGATEAALPPTSGLILTRDGAPAQAPAPKPAPAAAAAPITVLATTTRPKTIELRWRGGGKGRVRYRVRRNGRLFAVVRRLQLRDRSVRAGRLYRYRVTAVGPAGRVRRVSRVVRIRTPRPPRRGASAAVSAPRLHASFAAPRRSRWKRVYVEVRTRSRGAVRWRRLTSQTRPRAAMRFRVPVRRRAAVRVVLVSSTGAKLRSRVVRAGA